MNTVSLHTPGPYEVQPLQSSHGADLAIVAPANGLVVAIIPHDPDIQTVDEPDWETVIRHPQDMANARLIAAAPELLAALELAEDFIAGFEDDELQDGINERIATIRAAIAKAKGGAT